MVAAKNLKVWSETFEGIERTDLKTDEQYTSHQRHICLLSHVLFYPSILFLSISQLLSSSFHRLQEVTQGLHVLLQRKSIIAAHSLLIFTLASFEQFSTWMSFLKHLMQRT